MRGKVLTSWSKTQNNICAYRNWLVINSVFAQRKSREYSPRLCYRYYKAVSNKKNMCLKEKYKPLDKWSGTKLYKNLSLFTNDVFALSYWVSASACLFGIPLIHYRRRLPPVRMWYSLTCNQRSFQLTFPDQQAWLSVLATEDLYSTTDTIAVLLH